MVFSFSQARELKPEQVNPFANLISKAVQGYGQGVQAAYMPRKMEADIFNKTISPLAMLASSPFFSALNPAQQQQIGAYISQMLSNSPAGGGMGGHGGISGLFGGQQQGQQSGQPQEGGQEPSGNYSPEQGDQGGDGLVPGKPSEHFTQPFGETGYTPGKVHRDKSGNIISAPTGSQIERNQGILSGSSKVGKLYNEYQKLAVELADAGEIRRDISALAGGVGKLPFGGIGKKIEKALGGRQLAEKSAQLEDLEAKMRPALKEAGLTDGEIDNILHFRGGESGEALAKRFEKTRNYINGLTSQSQNILGGGFNVSSGKKAIANKAPPKSISQKINQDEQEKADAEATAKAFNTTPEKVMYARSLGVKTAKEFREFLKWSEEE